jgi:alkylation response protein AidB-like acyl-CoA dehydrogenase
MTSSSLPPMSPDDICRAAREFAEREIPTDLAREIDRQDRYPADLLDKFSQTRLWRRANCVSALP